MKKIMEMLQNMKAKNEKKDNKGFSLVELIIVIAIMAILVGVVGTQVLPYLNKSKEEKDRQVLSAYTTAAVSAYSMVSDQLKTDVTAKNAKIVVDVYNPAADDPTTLSAKIKELMGKGYTAATSKMTSAEGKKASAITITYDFDTQTVTTEATGSSLQAVKADL